MQTQQELDAAVPMLKQVYEQETAISNISEEQLNSEQEIQAQEKQEQDTSQTNLTRLQAQATILKLKRQSRIRSALYVSGGYSPVIISLIWNAFHHEKFDFTVFIFIQILVGLLCTLSRFAWMLHRQAKQGLGQINDIYLIGPLAEALDAEKMTKPKAVIMALRRLLPRLQATDAAILTRDQRLCLYRALKWRSMRGGMLRYDRGLALAILKAMEQIGDKDALPYVQNVATWSKDEELRDAANNCLRFLHQKTEEHRRSETYLRPSSAISTTPDILLRPASGVTATPSDELLRAGDKLFNSDNGQ